MHTRRKKRSAVSDLGQSQTVDDYQTDGEDNRSESRVNTNTGRLGTQTIGQRTPRKPANGERLVPKPAA